MEKIIKKTLLFVSLFVLSFLIDVNAEVLTTNVCYNKTTFQISYDSNRFPDVTNVINSLGEYLDAGNTADRDMRKDGYTFKSMMTTCVPKDDSNHYSSQFYTCPSEEVRKNYNLYLSFFTDGNFNVNLSNKKLTMRIKDNISNTVYVRIVSSSEANKNDFSIQDLKFNGVIYPSGGYYYYEFTPGSNMVVEFYEKSPGSACDGKLYFTNTIPIPTADAVNVPNPALTVNDPNNYYGCASVVNSNYPHMEKFVPWCYNSNVSVSDLYDLKGKISSAYKEISNFYSGFKTTYPSNGNFECIVEDGNTNRNSYTDTISYSYEVGTYFTAKCDENVTVTIDPAIKTIAGGGFEYKTDLTYNRHCEIIPHKGARSYSQACHCSVSCWGMNKDNLIHAGGPGAGPNQGFDECVKTCDGGKYSQDCINQCYNTIYGGNSETSQTLSKKDSYLFSNEMISSSTTKIDSVQELIPYTDANGNINWSAFFRDKIPAGAKVWEGNLSNYDGCWRVKGGWWCNACQDSDNGKTIVEYAWSCGQGNAKCWEVRTPVGCSTKNVNSTGGNGIYEQYNNDYQNVRNSLLSYAPFGSYQYEITDSYNQKKVYVVRDNGQPGLNVSHSNGSCRSSNNQEFEIQPYLPEISTIDKNGEKRVIRYEQQRIAIRYDQNYDCSASSHMELPNAYVEKGGEETFYGDSQAKYRFNYGKGEALVHEEFNSSNFYAGGRKFYTSVFSPNINLKDDTMFESYNNRKYNIKVSAFNLGTAPSSSQKFKPVGLCLYGLVNRFLRPPCTENCGPEGDFSIIFRPVELTDLFPAREPRWNWTDAATLNPNGNDPYLGYVIKPSVAIKQIETKGNTIITDNTKELDYQINLNRGNIYNIKKYNLSSDEYKTNKSYTDFDVTCNVGNYFLCKSNFLENIKYISNAGDRNSRLTQIGTNMD